MAIQRNNITITFAVSGWPETSGLRIKTLSPKGFYVSSRNVRAAQWYFETTVMQLIMERELIEFKRGEGLTFSKHIDWDQALAKGTFDLIIKHLSRHETNALMDKGERVDTSPVEALAVDWLDSPIGRICLIADIGDYVDEWLIKAVESDLPEIAAPALQ